MVDQVLQHGGTFWTQSQTAATGQRGTSVTINDTAPTTDYWNLALVEILGECFGPFGAGDHECRGGDVCGGRGGLV